MLFERNNFTRSWIISTKRVTSQRRKMTRGVFTRLVSPMIYIGIWQDLFEHRVGNPITINLARFFTFLSNFTQLQAGYLSNSLKREKEKVEEEEEREKKNEKIQLQHFVRAAIRIIINKRHTKLPCSKRGFKQLFPELIRIIPREKVKKREKKRKKTRIT